VDTFTNYLGAFTAKMALVNAQLQEHRAALITAVVAGKIDVQRRWGRSIKGGRP